MRRALLGAILLLAATPAFAQKTEMSGLGGITPSVALDNHARQIDEAKIGEGLTVGVQAAHFLKPHWGIEALWTLETADFKIATPNGSADLFAMTAGTIHANLVYQHAALNARIQPFVFGGVGATFYWAVDIPSEHKLSYGAGAGVKMYLWKDIGLRAQFRYKPTRLNDAASGDFCDAFGFCQQWLHQFDALAGVVLRF